MEYIPAKHLLYRSRSTQWFGTDHTMNIYRGCCHGCLYCDSRSDCCQIGNSDKEKPLLTRHALELGVNMQQGRREHFYEMKSIIRAVNLGYGDRQLTFFD